MSLISVIGSDGRSHIIHSGDIGPNPRPARSLGAWDDVWSRVEAQMGERNEHTSPQILREAAQVMHMTDEQLIEIAEKRPGVLRSIAASAVTQARDTETDARD